MYIVAGNYVSALISSNKMDGTLSILGLIVETATRKSSSTFRRDLYLFLIYISAEKVFSHGYVDIPSRLKSRTQQASWN